MNFKKKKFEYGSNIILSLVRQVMWLTNDRGKFASLWIPPCPEYIY